MIGDRAPVSQAGQTEDMAAVIKLLQEALPKISFASGTPQQASASLSTPQSSTTVAPPLQAISPAIASVVASAPTSSPVSSLVMMGNPQPHLPPFLTLDSITRENSQPHQLHSPTAMSYPPALYPVHSAPSAQEQSMTLCSNLPPIYPSAQPYGQMYTQPAAQIFSHPSGQICGPTFHHSPTQACVAQSPPHQASGWTVSPAPQGLPTFLTNKGYSLTDEKTPLLNSIK